MVLKAESPKSRSQQGYVPKKTPGCLSAPPLSIQKWLAKLRTAPVFVSFSCGNLLLDPVSPPIRESAILDYRNIQLQCGLIATAVFPPKIMFTVSGDEGFNMPCLN